MEENLNLENGTENPSKNFKSKKWELKVLLKIGKHRQWKLKSLWNYYESQLIIS